MVEFEANSKPYGRIKNETGFEDGKSKRKIDC